MVINNYKNTGLPPRYIAEQAIGEISFNGFGNTFAEAIDECLSNVWDFTRNSENSLAKIRTGNLPLDEHLREIADEVGVRIEDYRTLDEFIQVVSEKRGYEFKVEDEYLEGNVF